MRNILVVSPVLETYDSIRSSFSSDHEIQHANSLAQALQMLRKKRYELVFADLNLLEYSADDNTYGTAMQLFWQLHPSIEILVIADCTSIRKAVTAVKAGARDYLTSPIDPDEVKYVSESISESILLESELDYLRDQFWLAESADIVQTKSEPMKAVLNKIRSVAPTRSTVLLSGETGTGKSLLANLIHRHSNRRDAQFISVHCGAIPETLLESELFGHEKGAFTGAIRRKLGKFEIAKGGTIFLDEIGTMTPSAQIKLLNVMQDGSFQRVGGEETLHANVRIITATNADLQNLSEQGQFRKDLYYRLNVFPIDIPPLRMRLEDLGFICGNILKNLNKYNQKDIRQIHPSVMEAFKLYHWPGNIRELENLIERAYILESSSVLTPQSFPNELFDSMSAYTLWSPDASMTLAEARQRGIEELERNYLQDLLLKYKGRINASAREAGISTRQLNKLMNKYGIRKEAFKSLSKTPAH